MKILSIILSISSVFILNSMEKPVILTGTSSTANMTSAKNSDIYPSIIKDSVYTSISEDFSDYFSMKERVDFEYESFNKYSEDPVNLNSCSFKSSTEFFFNFARANQFSLDIKPGFNYQNGEKHFTDSAIVQYRLDLKYFRFVTYYSNRFTLKKNELVYHKINFAFYWNIPEKEYIKFKCAFNVVLQNCIYESKNISPLKSLNFTMEMAIDFNRIDFDEVFDRSEADEEN
jgi:hypothetical protein